MARSEISRRLFLAWLGAEALDGIYTTAVHNAVFSNSMTWKIVSGAGGLIVDGVAGGIRELRANGISRRDFFSGSFDEQGLSSNIEDIWNAYEVVDAPPYISLVKLREGYNLTFDPNDPNVFVPPYKGSYYFTQDTHPGFNMTGIDISVGKGGDVFNPIKGKVVGNYTDGYGNTKLVVENELFRVTMAHGNYFVTEGQELNAGEPVGKEGNNGQVRSMGGGGYHTHLIVENIVTGEVLDPGALLGLRRANVSLATLSEEGQVSASVSSKLENFSETVKRWKPNFEEGLKFSIPYWRDAKYGGQIPIDEHSLYEWLLVDAHAISEVEARGGLADGVAVEKGPMQITEIFEEEYGKPLGLDRNVVEEGIKIGVIGYTDLWLKAYEDLRRTADLPTVSYLAYARYNGGPSVSVNPGRWDGDLLNHAQKFFAARPW